MDNQNPKQTKKTLSRFIGIVVVIVAVEVAIIAVVMNKMGF